MSHAMLRHITVTAATRHAIMMLCHIDADADAVTRHALLTMLRYFRAIRCFHFSYYGACRLRLLPCRRYYAAAAAAMSADAPCCCRCFA